MKNLFILILCLLVFCKAGAQKIQAISALNIDEAIPKFENISTFEGLNTVRLLGIGDVGMFAKEPKKFNLSFSAYLISKKKFRNIVLTVDDWLLRPLNSYLTSSMPTDTSELDTLIKSVFDTEYGFRNREFKSFLSWVKQYNSGRPQEMVNLIGVAPVTIIPPSYFLAAYIYPIDVTYGQKLSTKWSDNNTLDSVAFSDVSIWIDRQKNQPQSKQHQTLISRCAEDLLHNKSVLIRKTIDQKFSQNEVNKRNQFVAGQILKTLDKKTIYLGLNREVVKANLKSTIVANDLPYISIGSYLKNILAENYRIYVTDFAESAKLPVANLSTQKIELESISGSDQAKTLYAKSDHFEIRTNAGLLKGYVPSFLSHIKDDSRIVVEKDQNAFDGVFIFPLLSEIDLTY